MNGARHATTGRQPSPNPAFEKAGQAFDRGLRSSIDIQRGCFATPSFEPGSDRVYYCPIVGDPACQCWPFKRQSYCKHLALIELTSADVAARAEYQALGTDGGIRHTWFSTH